MANNYFLWLGTGSEYKFISKPSGQYFPLRFLFKMGEGYYHHIHFESPVQARCFIEHLFRIRVKDNISNHDLMMYWGDEEGFNLKYHLDWLRSLYDLEYKINHHDEEFCVINLHPFSKLIRRAEDNLIEEIWGVECMWFEKHNFRERNK